MGNLENHVGANTQKVTASSATWIYCPPLPMKQGFWWWKSWLCVEDMKSFKEWYLAYKHWNDIHLRKYRLEQQRASDVKPSKTYSENATKEKKG